MRPQRSIDLLFHFWTKTGFVESDLFITLWNASLFWLLPMLAFSEIFTNDFIIASSSRVVTVLLRADIYLLDTSAAEPLRSVQWRVGSGVSAAQRAGSGATTTSIAFVGCWIMLLRSCDTLHCKWLRAQQASELYRNPISEVVLFLIGQWQTCLCLMRGCIRCLFRHQSSRFWCLNLVSIRKVR